MEIDEDDEHIRQIFQKTRTKELKLMDTKDIYFKINRLEAAPDPSLTNKACSAYNNGTLFMWR